MFEEMEKLSPEILFEILKLLPREELLNNRSVNNEFNDVAQEHMIIPDEELSSVLSHFNRVAGIEEVQPNHTFKTIDFLAKEIKDYSEIYKINFEKQFFASLTNSLMLNDTIQIDEAIRKVFENTRLRLFLQKDLVEIIENELRLYENIKYTDSQQIKAQEKKLFRSFALVMLGGFILGGFLLAFMSVSPLILGAAFIATAAAMSIGLAVFMKQHKDLSNDAKDYDHKCDSENQLESMEKNCENLEGMITFFSSHLKMPDEQNKDSEISYDDVELNDHDTEFCFESTDDYDQEEFLLQNS